MNGINYEISGGFNFRRNGQECPDGLTLISFHIGGFMKHLADFGLPGLLAST